MRQRISFLFAFVALGLASACGGDDTVTTGTGGSAGSGGSSGSGGTAGSGGSAGTGGGSGGVDAGPGGSGGSGGVDSSMGGSGDSAPDGGTGGGTIDVVITLPPPALQPDAGTVTCPTVITGSLDTTDPTQTGRHSRFGAASACGMTKAYPGNAADTSNPHFYDVYRFSNPTASAVCFTFNLTYPNPVADAGADTQVDAVSVDAPGVDAVSRDAVVDAVRTDAVADVVSSDATADAVSVDATNDVVATEGGDASSTGDGAVSTEAGDAASSDASEAGFVGAQRYMTAYSTFYPADISIGYLGDVGGQQVPPQPMAITVPAGGTIDVVVYAIDVAPAGAGTYTLSCATQ